MTVALKKVLETDKEILRNLLEKYQYEFSQYTNIELNQLGLYGYSYLDYYWTENKRWAYFIIVNDQIAGFAMVIDLPEVDDRPTDFQMAEFFIVHKYRNKHVGKKAVFQVLDIHKGKWQLKAHPKNLGSTIFWTKTIHAYTNGNFECIRNYPNTEYEDGICGDIYFFESL
ncbi:MAG: GNAT family N-acetyltransferase [Tenericutes bacterium]|nr:GNAT family N-acetyltransferase [Mycoplasmatota bacterium]